MVEHRIQNLDSVSCGIFQLYFCDNLFNPEEDSKIQDKAELNKKNYRDFAERTFCFRWSRNKRGDDKTVCKRQ